MVGLFYTQYSDVLNIGYVRKHSNLGGHRGLTGLICMEIL